MVDACDDVEESARVGDAQPAVLEAFARFDVSGDGIIDRQELAAVLQELAPESWSDSALDSLMEAMDTNRDGKVQYAEFINWLFEGKSDLSTGGVPVGQEDVDKEDEPEDEDEEDEDEEDEDEEDELEDEDAWGAIERASKSARNLVRTRLMPAKQGSAVAAAEMMKKLPPPDKDILEDHHHAELYLRHYPGVDADLEGVCPPGAERAKALRWLHAALARVSEGDKRYALPAKWLVGNRRLWPDSQDEEEQGFVALKAFAESNLETIGNRYEQEVFIKSGLGNDLGEIGKSLKQTRPRQDSVLRMPKSIVTEKEFYDTTYIALLLTAVHAVDRFFQNAAKLICETSGGESRSPPPKGFMRMLAKLDTDHANATPPRAAENIDTNRVAWIFDEPAQLHNAFEGAREVFGDPLRSKNGYDPEFDALDETKGYRNILANYRFAPDGLTWGSIAHDHETVKAWQTLRQRVLDTFLNMGYEDEESLEDEYSQYLRRFDVSRVHLSSKGMADVPVVLIVEVQYMLRPYFEMRKYTHAWYKIIRAECAEALLLDFTS